jgi:hypothetical protein
MSTRSENDEEGVFLPDEEFSDKEAITKRRFFDRREGHMTRSLATEGR